MPDDDDHGPNCRGLQLCDDGLYGGVSHFKINSGMGGYALLVLTRKHGELLYNKLILFQIVGPAATTWMAPS